MTAYYEALQKEITKNNENIERFADQRKALEDNRSNMSEEDYQRETTLLSRYTGLEKTKLNINEKIKKYYDTALNTIKDLEQAIIAYRHTTIPSTKAELEGKISYLRESLENVLTFFPPKVKDELDKELVEAEKRMSVKEQAMSKLEKLKADLERVEDEYNSSINAFMGIFSEEKKEFENKEFTEEEYNAFMEKYAKKKEEESSRLLNAKAKKEELTAEIENYSEEEPASPTEPIVKINNPLEHKPSEQKEGPKIVPSYAAQNTCNMSSKDLVQVTNVTIPEKPRIENKDLVQKGLSAIINDLTENLKLPQPVTYTYDDLRVDSAFISEVRSDEYKYHISHQKPEIVKAPTNTIPEIILRVKNDPKVKYRVNHLRERIDKLNDEDLETLANEFHARKFDIARFPTALNILLDERINRYLINKKD